VEKLCKFAILRLFHLRALRIAQYPVKKLHILLDTLLTVQYRPANVIQGRTTGLAWFAQTVRLRLVHRVPWVSESLVVWTAGSSSTPTDRAPLIALLGYGGQPMKHKKRTWPRYGRAARKAMKPSALVFPKRALPPRDILADRSFIATVASILAALPMSSAPLSSLRSHPLFRCVEELASLGVWEYCLPDDTFCYSDGFAKVVSLTPSDRAWPFQSIRPLLPCDDFDKLRRQCIALARSGEPTLAYSAVDWFGSHTRRTLFVPIPGSNGKTNFVVGVTQDVTVMTAAEEEMRRLSHRLITAQNDEQRRLSRILHETASQTLAAIKLTLVEAARLAKTSPVESSATIADARGLVQDALREVRSVSALLHPPMLEEAGLAAALDGYIRSFAERSGLRVRFHMPDDEPRMSRDLEITLFRVVQESLTNVHRHAKAKHCIVRIRQSAASVSLEISDDGIGIRQFRIRGSNGNGLGVGISSMRERIEQHSGTFHLGEARGGGTSVTVELPIQHRAPLTNTQENQTCHPSKPKSRTFRHSNGTGSKSPTTIASYVAASAPSLNSSPISKSPRRPAPARKPSST